MLETHIHNDYVTGGLQLARDLGATYVVPAGYELRYEALQLRDGDAFASGPMAWRALHTPGHTPQHLSYVVAIEGIDAAAFTGGSLLYGSVGRPDLIGPHMTQELAHAQWHSVRRLTSEVAGHAGGLPDARLRLLLLAPRPPPDWPPRSPSRRCGTRRRCCRRRSSSPS